MKLQFIVSMLIVLLVTGVHAQQDAAGPEDIKQLVENLLDGNWRTREQAQRRLIQIGRPAVPYVRALTDDAVFEVRFRAREILSYIRVVSAEDAAVIEKCLQEFDPGAEKGKVWRRVIKLRRLKNVRFYLIEKMANTNPGQSQELKKMASLLACVEYRIEGRRVDADTSYTTDILLSFARDQLLETQLKLRALRALARLGDRDAAATLVDVVSREHGKLANEALDSLRILAGKHDPQLKREEIRGNKILTWWSEASKTADYEKAVKHLKLRIEFEDKESQEKIPFLGVVKDEGFADAEGAHVERPWPDSGATKGGVEAGDTIVEFDGRPVENWADMVHGIRRGHAGQKILLKVLRSGRELELEVVLGKRPEDQ